METYNKKMFYGGIAYGEYPPQGQKLKKTGLPLKKLDREFPYLLGDGRGNAGKLQVYFSLLPEYSGKTLIGGKPKIWKPDVAEKFLRAAGEKAYIRHECAEQMIVTNLKKYGENLPTELWAVCLYQKRPFDSVCVSMTPDGGEQELWCLVELLTPYLPRMRRVAFRGPENQISEQFGDYLYEEFGIIMTETGKIPKDMLYLDFKNRYEPLKFLDTVVKNSYNTKVN